MKTICLLALALAGPLAILAAAENALPSTDPGPSVPSVPHPIPLSAFSAVGSSFTESSKLAHLGWTEEQFAAFLDGVRATFHGKSFPVSDDSKRLIAEMARSVSEVEAKERQKEFADPARLAAYMKSMRKRFSLEESDSGLSYGQRNGGPGVRPRAEDTVTLTIHAVASDIETNLPQLAVEKKRMKVSDLIPGLAEGVQMMTLGAENMFIVPPDLSYGNGEWPPGVDRGTPIIYIVTLHEVVSPDAAP